jgi:hypothetical protein
MRPAWHYTEWRMWFGRCFAIRDVLVQPTAQEAALLSLCVLPHENPKGKLTLALIDKIIDGGVAT